MRNNKWTNELLDEYTGRADETIRKYNGKNGRDGDKDYLQTTPKRPNSATLLDDANDNDNEK